MSDARPILSKYWLHWQNNNHSESQLLVNIEESLSAIFSIRAQYWMSISMMGLILTILNQHLVNNEYRFFDNIG